jgi:hypothetical protein
MGQMNRIDVEGHEQCSVQDPKIWALNYLSSQIPNNKL